MIGILITNTGDMTMSEDEDFRQLVVSRATNWGKGIQKRVEQKIRRLPAPYLEIK